jgi:alpha-ketoglutarate-dependent 2,4-dichlorophenoxyacetate dioxygenase
MQMQVLPLTPVFGGEIDGLDISRATPELAETCFELFDRYAVCVFRETGLTDVQHVAFSRLFGELELAPKLRNPNSPPRFDLPELFDAGNLDREGNIIMDALRQMMNRGNQFWHTDSSFRPARSSYSMLLSHRIPPEGGDTQFTDTRAAYAALPDSMKQRIEGLKAEHSYWYSRSLAGHPPATPEQTATMSGAVHPLVLRHPRTGQPALYVASHASHIVGMDIDEGRALLKELTNFATQPQFRYVHKWKVGDLVVWDNLCTMHRGTPFDDTAYPRDMRRTTIIDGTPLREKAAA